MAAGTQLRLQLPVLECLLAVLSVQHGPGCRDLSVGAHLRRLPESLHVLLHHPTVLTLEKLHQRTGLGAVGIALAGPFGGAVEKGLDPLVHGELLQGLDAAKVDESQRALGI